MVGKEKVFMQLDNLYPNKLANDSDEPSDNESGSQTKNTASCNNPGTGEYNWIKIMWKNSS